MRAIAAAGDNERLLERLVGIDLPDPAIFEKTVDHVVAALDGAVMVLDRMQQGRRLRQRGEVGGFRHREFVHGFVEIDQRCGRDAVSAEAKIDMIEVELENLVLGIGALDSHRQQGFLDLANERHFAAEEKVLGDLLGDRGGALGPTVGSEILHVKQCRARHAGEIDAAMLVEILVLGSQEGVGDQFWNRLDRQIQPAFPGIFAKQLAVSRMNARHDRRLIGLKLRIVRQVLGEMPQQPGHAGRANQK